MPKHLYNALNDKTNDIRITGISKDILDIMLQFFLCFFLGSFSNLAIDIAPHWCCRTALVVLLSEGRQDIPALGVGM